MQAICQADGCGKELRCDNTTGFCRPHRAVKNRSEPRSCAVEDCGRLLHTKSTSGFCPLHAVRRAPAVAKRRAEAAERKSQWPTCAADHCTNRLRPQNKSGRCWRHGYVPVSAAERGQCPIEGCGKRLSPKNTVGRCEKHMLPRWVAAECAAEGCTKKLNVTNLIGFCGEHTNGYRRTVSLQRNYGITEEDYDAMVVAQNGLCAVCGKPPKTGGVRAASRLHVDHDHVTGRVRALLCLTCNHGLGNFYDNPELMRAAAAYVEAFRLPAAPLARAA